MSRRGFGLDPARIVVLTFAGAIVVGTLLLLIPAATAPGERTDVITALFTATSAVCVTGLTVVTTSTHWTILGKVIILFLIQVGGLGIMTLSTLIFLILGRRISLRERIVIQESLGQSELTGVVRLVRRILIMTGILEGVGALILAARWAFDLPPGQALWFGVFHAISAFNNAGFDLFGTSLVGYAGDVVVNVTILGLIVLGGIGFVVIDDVWTARRRRSRISLHSRMVLRLTAALIVIGSAGVLLIEATNPGTLGRLPWPTRVIAAVFQGVAPRTAGYYSVDIGSMQPLTLLFITILMFIGASPGGT
ncbi:MAG: Trk family potassium uptake protein, partial [Dactylosporangium sp.]|nr:Trk family potassium uptake protein [Dactylosporangium sp.]